MNKISYNDIKRGLKIPKTINKYLAEEIGIHVGDGSLGIYKHKSGIKYLYTISGHHNDELYFRKFIIPLMYRLYNIYPSIYKRKDEKSMELNYQSKGLIHFKKSIGLPLGKKEEIVIPKKIIMSNFKLDFIRGIFDTDGCLCFKKRYRKFYYYPCINISNKSDKLIIQIYKILKREKFRVSITLNKQSPDSRGKLCTTSDLNLYGKDNVIKWMSLIGTSNPRTTFKFNIWKRYGYIPNKIASGGI